MDPAPETTDFAPSFGSSMEETLAKHAGLMLANKARAHKQDDEGEDGEESNGQENNATHGEGGEEEDEEGEEEEEVVANIFNPNTGTANWVHTVATVPNTDLLATGSCDGVVRLWGADTPMDDSATIQQVCQVPLAGWVNGLAFSSSASHLVAVAGPSHRLGRWYSATGKGARNQLLICKLNYDVDISDLQAFEASKGVPEHALPPKRVKKGNQRELMGRDMIQAKKKGAGGAAGPTKKKRKKG